MSSLSVVFVACSVLSLYQTPAAHGARDDTPPPLKRLQRDRAAWKTARIEWVLESSETVSTPRFYEAQLAGSDKLIVDYGDEEGVISRYADGAPQPYGFGPFYTLHTGEEVWRYGEGRVDANLTKNVPTEASVDFRTLGLSPQRHCGGLRDALGGNLSETAGSVKYSIHRENGLEIIRATAGDYTVTWNLDPASGGLPVAVTAERDGQTVAQSRSTLCKFGDVWYPSRVEYYREGDKGGLDPYEVVEVQAVETNPPDIPARLSPEYIHIDAGVNVNVREDGFNSEVVHLRKWSGKKALSLDKYAEEYLRGKIKNGPFYTANAARVEAMIELDRAHELESGDAPNAPPPAQGAGNETEPAALEQLTGWEAYTVRFIDKYRLDQAQTQKAIQILRQCQGLARKHTQRNKKAFVAIEQSSSTKDVQTESRRAAVLKPLKDIFEQQLKPRLDALLTRHQRSKVAPPSRRDERQSP